MSIKISNLNIQHIQTQIEPKLNDTVTVVSRRYKTFSTIAQKVLRPGH